MNVSVGFDELSIRVLNGLGPTYSHISHTLQARDTPVTFEELFERLLSYEAQLRILVPSSPPTSTLATALVTSICHSSHRRSHNRGGRNHNRSQQSEPLLDTPPLGIPTNYSSIVSVRHPAPLTQLRHSLYLERCQICGITGHSTKQCSYLSTSALASLPPAPSQVKCLTFTAPYAPTSIHYSNPGNSSDWFVDSGASHHGTMDLAHLVLHEPYTASDSVLIGDGKGLSIANIGSFTLTSLLTP